MALNDFFITVDVMRQLSASFMSFLKFSCVFVYEKALTRKIILL